MKISSVKIATLATVAGFGILGLVHGEDLFAVGNSGSFYHQLSTLPNAYDFQADAQVPAANADANKDIVSTDDHGGFDGNWKAGNATLYVNTPSLPVYLGTSTPLTWSKVDSAYKAGTPITAPDKAGTGSKHIYVANLRGTGTYVVVRFTTRVGSNTDCNCPDPGIVTFDYWKQGPAPTSVKPLFAERKQSLRVSRAHGQLTIVPMGKSQVINLLGQVVPGTLF